MWNLVEKSIMSVWSRNLCRLLLFTGVLGVPALGHASNLMTRSEMRKEAEKARGRAYNFEVTCDVEGAGSLEIRPSWFADVEPTYPPELARCMVFGNQDRARYVCLCADTEDPVAGTIGRDKIPSLKKGPAGPDAFDAFDELCTGQFNAACGPFPEPVEAICENDDGECFMIGHGNRREGELSVVGSGCECSDGSVWYLQQDLKDELALDQSTASGLCDAQLASCQGESGPVLHDFQTCDGDAYSRGRFGCVDDEDERYDECVIEVRDDGAHAKFRCDCSGNYVSGEVEVDREGTARSMYAGCRERLHYCKGFDPVDDNDDGDDDPWPSDSAWKDFLDALGCRAVPSTGFGFRSLLGLGMLIALSTRFRRRRGG